MTSSLIVPKWRGEGVLLYVTYVTEVSPHPEEFNLQRSHHRHHRHPNPKNTCKNSLYCSYSRNRPRSQFRSPESLKWFVFRNWRWHFVSQSPPTPSQVFHIPSKPQNVSKPLHSSCLKHFVQAKHHPPAFFSLPLQNRHLNRL